MSALVCIPSNTNHLCNFIDHPYTLQIGTAVIFTDVFYLTIYSTLDGIDVYTLADFFIRKHPEKIGMSTYCLNHAGL